MEIENWIECGRAAAWRDWHEKNQNHKICAHTVDIQISLKYERVRHKPVMPTASSGKSTAELYRYELPQ